VRSVDRENSGANADQAKYWAEHGGPSWVRDEVVYDMMLAPFNHLLVEALAARPGERVLDVGCGFGSTALAVAAAGASVHGVDISPPMVRRAEERAAAARVGATFTVGDVQEDSLGGPYDAVTSRFGVMFFADPIRAFRNVAQATRHGGRLVFVCWQPLDRNPWMSAASDVLKALLEDPTPPPPASVGPFAFGDTAYLDHVLTNAGWNSISIAAAETPIRMGGNDGVAGAVDHALSSSAARALLSTGDDTLQARAAVILEERFQALSINGQVSFPAAAWLVSAALGGRTQDT